MTEMNDTFTLKTTKSTVSREEAIDGLRETLAMAEKFERINDPSFKHFPDMSDLIDLIDQQGFPPPQPKAPTNPTKELKRNNWINKEVISFLDGMKLCDKDGNLPKGDWHHADWNHAIEACKEMFYDFTREENSMGAMAYEPKTDTILHIGNPPP